MKKILALLLALVMALSCVGAIAEDAKADTAELPAFTVAFDSTVNVDALAALLPMFGADENTMAVLQTILPLLAETNGQLVFADNGVQLDLGLKGQKVLSVAAEQVEGGFALASDILPSYILTLANETIEEISKQFFDQAKEALSNVDIGALAQKVTGYAMKYMGTVLSAVTPGEPVTGEYTFEDLGVKFNCMTPIELDLEALKTAVEEIANGIKNDEAVASLINALGAMGMPVNMSEETTVIMPDEVKVSVYSNVDEKGNTVDANSLVVVNTVTQDVAVNVVVLVDSESVSVAVTVPELNITVSVAFMPTENGAAMNCTFQGMGLTAAETVVFSMGDVITLYSESFLMDMEKPISTETVIFAQGGERDFAVLDENKTPIAVEQLLADSEGGIASVLLADVSTNGLGVLITKAAEIMPEEVTALMTLFFPEAL